MHIQVTAFQWGWQFYYPATGKVVEGETTEAPQMVVPTGETVDITPASRPTSSTASTFPQFNYSRYAQPGTVNHFNFNVLHNGVYRGQCTQLCGLYHSLMLFSVKAVTPSQFAAWVHQVTGEQRDHRPAQGTDRGERPRSMTDVITPGHRTAASTPGRARHRGHVSHAHEEHGPSGILKWLTSTDHKVIGMSYMITSLVLFYVAGIMALIMRLQLATPNASLVSFQQYNELFTMHGSLMLYLFAGPFAFGGLANYIVPLQVGAPDMAFPRLNALSYWLYLTGSITMMLGFLVAGGAASFGWVAYAPLSNATNSPGPAATSGSWP